MQEWMRDLNEDPLPSFLEQDSDNPGVPCKSIFNEPC